MLAADVPHSGLDIALALSAFAFGFRHGIDWDHIAAITDITSSQVTVRTGLRFATLYAAGHGIVVFVIGVLAIVAGERLPVSLDETMGRVVGVTLIFLGVYVLYALMRHGRDFRLRSRWMLLFMAVRSGYAWLRRRLGRNTVGVTHEHTHAAVPFHHANVHDHAAEDASHTHAHTHTDPFMNYGTGTSLVIGFLHGIGAETPTQILIFLAAAGAGGRGLGIVVLIIFLVGLFTANSVLAVATASGFLVATKRFTVYATVSVITALASLAVGVIFLLGATSVLPAFFGG